MRGPGSIPTGGYNFVTGYFCFHAIKTKMSILAFLCVCEKRYWVHRERKVFQSDWSVTRGYQTVCLCDGVRDKRRLVHASIGVQPPELLHRNHSCSVSPTRGYSGNVSYYAPSQFVRFINAFDRLSLAEGYFFQNENSFDQFWTSPIMKDLLERFPFQIIYFLRKLFIFLNGPFGDFKFKFYEHNDQLYTLQEHSLLTGQQIVFNGCLWDNFLKSSVIFVCPKYFIDNYYETIYYSIRSEQGRIEDSPMEVAPTLNG